MSANRNRKSKLELPQAEYIEMKVVNFVVEIFSVLFYLTVGSFLIIVALHIVGFDDAIKTVNQIYQSPMRSLEIGCLGLVFILMGLTLAKIVVKRGRSEDALVFEGEMGKIRVSIDAIQDVTRKVLKKFHLVKESKIKARISDKNLELKIRLTLWSGGSVQDLVNEIQLELRQRLTKILGLRNNLEIKVDVVKVLETKHTEETQEI